MGDCSNGGLSSKHQKVLIVNAEGPFDPTPTCPAVLLRKGPINTIHAVPAKLDVYGKWVPEDETFSFGGTYVACCDSRFGAAVRRVGGQDIYGAIAFHDRPWSDLGPG
jgi:hypothetical protein